MEEEEEEEEEAGGGRGGENLTNGSEVRENKKGSKEEVGEGTMVQNSLIWRNQNSYFPTSFGASVVSK